MVSLAEDGMSMICVTHELNFARNVAHRIIFMDQGRIIEDQAPEDFFNKPKSERTKLFLDQILSHSDFTRSKVASKHWQSSGFRSSRSPLASACDTACLDRGYWGCLRDLDRIGSRGGGVGSRCLRLGPTAVMNE